MLEFGNQAKQEVGRWVNKRGKQSPAHPKTGTGDAALQAAECATEVRFRSRERPQPLSSDNI
jgi:hypothetical protein